MISLVGKLIAVERGIRARRDAQEHGDGYGDQTQSCGNGEFFADNLIYGESDTLIRIAQIKRREAFHVHEILFEQRLVQSVLLLHHFDGFRAGAFRVNGPPGMMFIKKNVSVATTNSVSSDDITLLMINLSHSSPTRLQCKI
jgi:hypothetical protein